MDILKVIEPNVKRVPIIISIPHSGTYIPDDIKKNMIPAISDKLDNTDWFIDRLYDFATDFGIIIVKANYSRWVVDLNRDPANLPLYNDGRVITDVVPLSDFNGNQIYKVDKKPNHDELSNRISLYHKPYHDKLRELIHQTKSSFGKVLLFDAHSIRKNVPGIRNEDFPDLILGDKDGNSASNALIEITLDSLMNNGFELSHNDPFKGGYITRYFGKPKDNIHALQLEMCKSNYMDSSETIYDNGKADNMRIILKELFGNLIEKLDDI